MQELVGRLSALDPEATETLKVISYFDALVSGGVPVETLVRGAAVLTGTVAGVSGPRARLRVAPSGERIPESIDGGAPFGMARWPGAPVPPDDWVWIERTGPAHANDAMVLERLALSIGLRCAPAAAVGEQLLVVLDSSRPDDERSSTAARLGLNGDRMRVVVTDTAVSLGGPCTVMATAHGTVRATVQQSATLASPPESACIGLGRMGGAIGLADSWETALIAFRLTSDDEPQMDATDLGGLLDAVHAVDITGAERPDVTALAALDDRSLRVLRTLVHTKSVRAAAVELGMHHSTVQERHASLSRVLGYDPRGSRGRARFELADLLLRLGR